MKGYVYMIDYEDSYGHDQIECCDKKDLLEQVNLIANEAYKDLKVERIKLVKDNDRYIETDISKSLYAQIKKILKGSD